MTNTNIPRWPDSPVPPDPAAPPGPPGPTTKQKARLHPLVVRAGQMLSALLTQPPNLVRCDTADFHGFRAQGTTAALGVYANQLVLVNYVSEAQEALPIAAPFDDDDVALISFTGHIVTQQAQHYTVSRMV